MFFIIKFNKINNKNKFTELQVFKTKIIIYILYFYN